LSFPIDDFSTEGSAKVGGKAKNYFQGGELPNQAHRLAYRWWLCRADLGLGWGERLSLAGELDSQSDTAVVEQLVSVYSYDPAALYSGKLTPVLGEGFCPRKV